MGQGDVQERCRRQALKRAEERLLAQLRLEMRGATVVVVVMGNVARCLIVEQVRPKGDVDDDVGCCVWVLSASNGCGDRKREERVVQCSSSKAGEIRPAAKPFLEQAPHFSPPADFHCCLFDISYNKSSTWIPVLYERKT